MRLKKYNKPHVDVTAAQPTIVTGSQEILKEFQDDEKLANKKYLDQIVQVNGSISKLEASENNGIIVTLLNNNRSDIGTVILPSNF